MRLEERNLMAYDGTNRIHFVSEDTARKTLAPRYLQKMTFKRDYSRIKGCETYLMESSTVDRRIQKGIERSRQFEIEVDGEKIIAFKGETFAAALMAFGRRTFRFTSKKKHPRGVYCGIGLCHECLMVINGIPNTRACQTLATPGCRVKTQKGVGKDDDYL